MSFSVPNLGGTLTGGSTQVLTAVGMPNPGKVSFVTSDHSRLAQRQIDIFSSTTRTTPADAGVGRSGLKITFGDRLTEEGCCTVQAGSVIVDLGIRWSLNQPESLVDDALAELQALVFSPGFIQAVKAGILPS